MSNQCRNCGRDVNNNYTPYTNAYGNKTNAKTDSSSSKATNSSSGAATAVGTTSTATTATSTANQITAKVMFGTIGAINELREKEKAEKNSAARAGRRQ